MSCQELAFFQPRLRDGTVHPRLLVEIMQNHPTKSLWIHEVILVILTLSQIFQTYYFPLSSHLSWHDGQSPGSNWLIGYPTSVLLCFGKKKEKKKKEIVLKIFGNDVFPVRSSNQLGFNRSPSPVCYCCLMENSHWCMRIHEWWLYMINRIQVSSRYKNDLIK